jgi:hypothetical protein
MRSPRPIGLRSSTCVLRPCLNPPYSPPSQSFRLSIRLCCLRRPRSLAGWRDPNAFPSSFKSYKQTKQTYTNNSKNVDRKRNQAADRIRSAEPPKPCRPGPFGDLLRSVICRLHAARRFRWLAAGLERKSIGSAPSIRPWNVMEHAGQTSRDRRYRKASVPNS